MPQYSATEHQQWWLNHFRTEREEPRATESNTLKVLPKVDVERTDMASPNFTLAETDKLKKEPKRTMPMSETEEPNRAMVRTEMEDPTCAKSRVDKAHPNLAKLRQLKLELK